SLRALGGLETADFPAAFGLFAGGAFEPGFGFALDVARQEIAAGAAVLDIGRGDRGDGAARAAPGIFPRQARVLLVAPEDLARGDAGISEVVVRRQIGRRLGFGGRDRAGGFGLVAAEEG